MSTQSEALLALAGAYGELPEDARAQREAELYGNPIICTPRVLEDAEQDADPGEGVMLRRLLDRGLLVTDEDPRRKRAELAASRPGYRNRAARRAGKTGKAK